MRLRLGQIGPLGDKQPARASLPSVRLRSRRATCDVRQPLYSHMMRTFALLLLPAALLLAADAQTQYDVTEFDADESGILEPKEFTKFLQKTPAKGQSKAQIRDMFKNIDSSECPQFCVLSNPGRRRRRRRRRSRRSAPPPLGAATDHARSPAAPAPQTTTTASTRPSSTPSSSRCRTRHHLLRASRLQTRTKMTRTPTRSAWPSS